MPLTPDDVQNKRFTVVRFGKSGYDEEEVDSFLDEVEAEMRRLLADPALAKDAGTPAPPPAPVAAAVVEPPAPPPAPPAAPVEPPNETALRTLALAQQTADQLTSEAKTEADRVVGAARLRATALQQEAESTHAATLADLARQRSKVESEIAALRTYERDYRTRLRAYLEGQIDDLEQLTIIAEGGPQGSSPTRPPAAGPGTATTGSPPPLAGAPAGSAAPVTAGPPAVPGVAAATGGPFSSAPPPASGLFASAPAAVGTPTAATPSPGGPAGPTLGGPEVTLDTDVDATSDIPSSPPAEADHDGTDTVGG